MSRTLSVGFVPLIDSAVLVAASELGFAKRNGLHLQLVKQPSWAVLRDHLNLGYIDCAHALAPLPIATTLGIGQVQTDVFVPFVLGRGGNAITLGNALTDAIRAAAGDALSGASAWAEALAGIVRSRDKPLTLAMVYPFSGHNFELRYWLAAAGIHPDRDLRIVAIPPPLMVESLRAGHVDGFCVGEPWNSIARQQGLGEIVVGKSEIFPHGIEKVFAVPRGMIDDRELMRRLLRSLSAAAQWCDEPGNRETLAGLLARDEYLGIAPEIALQSLSGRLPIGGPATAGDADFLYFHKHGANRPRLEEAL